MDKSKGQQEPVRININPSELENFKCKKCNGIFFDEVIIYKKIPAVKSPTGQQDVMPLNVPVCNNCGEVQSELFPVELLKEPSKLKKK